MVAALSQQRYGQSCSNINVIFCRRMKLGCFYLVKFKFTVLFFFKKKTNTELSCSIVRNDYIWLSPHLDTSRSMSRSKHVRDDSLRLPSFNLFSSEVKMATASLTKICADDAGVLAQIRKLDPWKKKAVYRLFECIWIFTLLSVGSTFSIKIEDVSFDMDPERVRE